jgi:tRNA(Ile2)-agmatinylcytidine synthase
MKPLSPVIASGQVLEEPRTIPGGHVIFRMRDSTGEVDCAAYEPTGSFRAVVRQLIPGDRITVYGGVRDEDGRLTVNLEKLRVVGLAKEVQMVNPQCPQCSGSMESMGRDKGYRCRRCGYRDGKLVKVALVTKRDLTSGLYMPPPGAQRHLTKPTVRLGKEKQGLYILGPLSGPWFGLGEVDLPKSFSIGL